MSLKHYVPRKEYLLVLLLLSSALLMAASTPVAEEQQQQEGAMNEKCLYVDGSITCTGNTTCCSSGQNNDDLPQCIDPSTEQCCLHSNLSFSCPLNTQCCELSCCDSCGTGVCELDSCCTAATGNSVCCEEARCAPFLDSPCLPNCGSNDACPEPSKCCGDLFCYDPSTTQCCNIGGYSPWPCKSGQTCGGYYGQCCDQQACGEECYDANVSQCCVLPSSENSYPCTNAESCCSVGSGAYGICCPPGASCCPWGMGVVEGVNCCPADTSCCTSHGLDGSSCCYANQTCCANGSRSPVCCNEGEVCDWAYGDCVPATHSPEKEGSKGRGREEG